MLVLAILTIAVAAPASAARKDSKNFNESKKEIIDSNDDIDPDEDKDMDTEGDGDDIDSQEDFDEESLESNDSEKENENKSSSTYYKLKLKGRSVSDGKPGTGHRFPYGQCTWYVASKKYIPWSGNAGTWLDKAKRMGYATGLHPKEGSVVVFGGTYYGHVGLVERVKGDKIAISEMNYTGWGRMSQRNISVNDPKLKGFIY